MSKLKTEKQIAKSLRKTGDDLENENYHDSAAVMRWLADHVENGTFTKSCQVGSGAEFTYLDGHMILEALQAGLGGEIES